MIVIEKKRIRILMGFTLSALINALKTSSKLTTFKANIKAAPKKETTIYVLIENLLALIFGKKRMDRINKTQVIPAIRIDLSIKNTEIMISRI